MKTLRIFSLVCFILSSNWVQSQTSDDLYDVTGSENNTAVSSQDPATFGYPWPQLILSGQDSILVYQPQVEHLANNQLSGRCAVQVISPGKQASFGVMEFTSQVETDLGKNMVYLNDMHIQKTNFPLLPDGGAALSDAISQQLPQQTYLFLDQVKSDLAIHDVTQNQSVDVKNDPPTLYFSTSPAVLVLVDGKPETRGLAGSSSSSWLRVLNSSFFLIWNPSSKKYALALFGKWFSAPDLGGPWKITNDPALRPLLSTALQQDSNIQTFDPPSKEMAQLLALGDPPRIIVSTVPAELITTDGPPLYEPISQTNLLYVKNTSASIFKYVGDGMTYVLVSGRWYKARNVDETWTFVPPDQLPQDFRNIPSEHPAASALASIAGTPQAQEALISSEIPQTATIDRSSASLQMTYDGSPNFQPIDGTSMQYGVNTNTPVVLYDNMYYAISNGVWFTSGYPTGPWSVALNVPAAIYTIPPSNPIHYVTYARIYGYTPNYVYVGYTPGYYGCYVNSYGTVVYGTGWYYRPWIGRRWYGNPYTFGVGAYFTWSSWGGWNMRLGFGRPYYPMSRPWWGPMAYRPHTIWYQNRYSYNVYRNNRANVWNRQGMNRGRMVNHQFVPTSNFHRENPHHTPYFAGRDGNVYKQNGNGNWQSYGGHNGWQSVPNANNHPINSQYRSFQQGNDRFQAQQNYRNFNRGGGNANSSFSRPGGFRGQGGGGHMGGGGGMHGGAGHGGRR
jgi:hypothetical protein